MSLPEILPAVEFRTMQMVREIISIAQQDIN
jgi:hypothetical protein